MGSYDDTAWRRQLMLDLGKPATTAAGAGAVPAVTPLNAPAGAPAQASAIATTAAAAAVNPAPVVPAAGAAPANAAGDGGSTIFITTRRTSPSAPAPADSSPSGPAAPLASAAGKDESSGNILSQAVANSNLSWWQLICVAIAGILVIGVAVWAVFRQRRKKREDEERKKEVEALEGEAKRLEEGVGVKPGDAKEGEGGGAKGKGEGGGNGDESSEWDSEEYDSFSDGGTIRPSRRRIRRRDRDRYRHRDRRRGRDRRGRERYYSSEEDSDYSYHADRPRDRSRRHRRSPTPSPSPSPIARTSKAGKRKSFRDSVFSTYQSMKSAAVRLKQAEMSERLKKQLEDEERIEQVRQAKVKEANEAIMRERAWFELEKERERLKVELERERAGKGKERMGSSDSQQLLIPPANRPPSSTASCSSTSHSRRTPSRQASFPLPTPRRQNSYPHEPQIPPAARVRMPARGKTVDTVYPETGLGRDIHKLLGTQPKKSALAGGSKGLGGGDGVQGVVVKATKDRPTIPKGGLAPAPKGKKRGGSPISSGAGGGGGGGGGDGEGGGGGGGGGRGGGISPVVMDHGWPTSRPVLGGQGSQRSISGFGSSGASFGGASGGTVAGAGSGGGGGGGSKWADRMRARK